MPVDLASDCGAVWGMFSCFVLFLPGKGEAPKD